MKKNMNVQGRKSAGFTIIELMVAVAVTALLVSLMLTITVNVMGGWNKSSGTLTAGNQARTILDQMERDLQSAILKRDGNVWLVASIQTSASGGVWSYTKKPVTGSSSPAADSSYYIPALPALNALPADLETYRFGQGGVWLRFFTAVPDTNESNSRISAPRAVAYQIVRNKVPNNSSEERYLFYRSELAPDITFSTGYDLFDTVNYYSAGAGAVLRIPTEDAVIANNVVDFGVRFFTRRTTGELDLVFPDTADRSFAATSDTAKVGPSVDATPVRQFPVVAEIFIRILTDEGATQIANLEATPPAITGDWWDIALANSKVYTRRIEIKSTGL